MILVNDILMTSDGLATVLYKNKNGIIKLKLNQEPFTDLFIHKAKVEKFPLINRPKPIVQQKESLFGHGVIGNGPYRSVDNYKATAPYRAWRAMLQRVYSPTSTAIATAYADVTVCKDWHNFQDFAAWYERQIADRPGGVKWVLEKALLIPGNTEYRPDACCVVPQQISSTMSFKRTNRELPLGVTKNRNSPWYSVNCGSKLIGQYLSIDDAKNAYWSVKMQTIRDLGIQYWNHLPEVLATRLVLFDWSDAAQYFPKEFD